MNTTVTRKKDINTGWHLIDAQKETLGRVSTKIASYLMGKHKVTFTPNLVMGDKVVVINSDKLKLTGKKVKNKNYYTHSGYHSGLKVRNAEYYLQKDSTFIIKSAVSGMLPKNKLRDLFLKNLYVYKDSNHPHTQISNK